MNQFCHDRDLLAIEPDVFTTAGFAGQELISDSDGAISGTSFTSAAGDFVTTGIAAGMVVSITPSAGGARSYEIISVDSATSMTVSILRADTDDPATPPQAASGLSYSVRTFGPQIGGVSSTLAEKLRQLSEVAGVASADFADSAQLRYATAHGTLSSIFLARADNAAPFDANWIKAQYYREQFARLQLQLRLVTDTDANGAAETARTLGNVRLIRS